MVETLKVTDVQIHANQLIARHLTEQQQAKTSKVELQIKQVNDELDRLKKELVESQKNQTIKDKMSRLERKLDKLMTKQQNLQNFTEVTSNAHEDAFFHQSEFIKRSTSIKDGIVTLEVNSQQFIVLDMLYTLLLDHQKTALDWLLDQHTKSHGSILADEMGLGKTITTIALLYCLHLTIKK